jgi:hypothetical protein
MKIAVWSGPRNLSTALMYSFANRADFTAMDEPFYAPYLAATGLNHPMTDAILTTHETGPQHVAMACATDGAKAHKYMKHMPHHMLDGFPLDWTKDCVNIHLIRHPARVIASYAVKRENPTLDDVGYPQQLALYERIGGHIVDSYEIRQQPEKALKKLCSMIGIPFDSAMLSWSIGPRRFDGIWASHWYRAVHQSTGFVGPEGDLPELVGLHRALCIETMPYYSKLLTKKMTLI